jgi:hypothetical protein
MMLDNTLLENIKSIAYGFASFFKSVYAIYTSSYEISGSSELQTSHTPSIKVTDKDEYKAGVKNLKSTRSSGPDGILPYVFEGLFRLVCHTAYVAIFLSLQVVRLTVNA